MSHVLAQYYKGKDAIEKAGVDDRARYLASERRELSATAASAATVVIHVVYFSDAGSVARSRERGGHAVGLSPGAAWQGCERPTTAEKWSARLGRFSGGTNGFCVILACCKKKLKSAAAV